MKIWIIEGCGECPKWRQDCFVGQQQVGRDSTIIHKECPLKEATPEERERHGKS